MYKDYAPPGHIRHPDLCKKQLRNYVGRKLKNPPTVHVLGTLSNLILGKQAPIKYEDPWNPVGTIQIQRCTFPNTVVYLGVVINILTAKT